MTYLYIGEENIEEEINKLKENIDTNNISRYNLEEENINKAIDDINTFSLFDSKKLVIVENINLISDDNYLIKYLDNQNDNILILLSKEKLDDRKKITKKLKEKAQIIDLSNIDINSYIKNILGSYQMDYKAINTLISYCNGNLLRIKKEIEKLKLYKDSDKIITEEDVKKLVIKTLDSNIFDITKAISNKNKKQVFEVFNQLINNNVDEISILGVIASNFRLILKIKLLLEQRKTEEEIKQILKIHPYRLKLLKEEALKYNTKEIMQIVVNLSNTDISIKKGDIDKRLAMELFLSKL